MAQSAYLTLSGQKQGSIQGSVTQAGREGTILVHSFDCAITIPRDPASGLPTGKRQHSPIVILKEIDKSSPRLWEALVTNEILNTWILRFYSPTPTGTVTQSYTITLTNATIASIDESMADNAIPDNLNLPMREQVSFTYQKIQWTWTDGAITAQDDWTV
jgi:type VI secretion system secreted protein Hcp